MAIFGNTMKNELNMSTNMPGIGALLREIAVKISEMWESKHSFAL